MFGPGHFDQFGHVFVFILSLRKTFQLNDEYDLIQRIGNSKKFEHKVKSTTSTKVNKFLHFTHT